MAYDGDMLACVVAHLGGRTTIMRVITSAVALSAFLSFFVWVSVLATQTSRNGLGPRLVHLHELPPAR